MFCYMDTFLIWFNLSNAVFMKFRKWSFELTETTSLSWEQTLLRCVGTLVSSFKHLSLPSISLVTSKLTVPSLKMCFVVEKIMVDVLLPLIDVESLCFPNKFTSKKKNLTKKLQKYKETLKAKKKPTRWNKRVYNFIIDAKWVFKREKNYVSAKQVIIFVSNRNQTWKKKSLIESIKTRKQKVQITNIKL